MADESTDPERKEGIETAAEPTACTVVGRRTHPLVRSLVARLQGSKRWDITVADPTGAGVESITAEEELPVGKWTAVDVLDRSQVREAIRGSSVVFLMDLAESSRRDFYSCYMALVQGTKMVISVCKECNVKRLMYNSSADVIFDGLHHIQNGNESLPYPHKFEDMLNDLKAQAEAIVLLANGNSGLLTCALRPSNMFGPRDVHLVKSLIDEAKAGRFKFITGSNDNLVDFTYVENVAHAHLLAEKALCADITSVAGKTFFITNLESTKIWEFLYFILEGLGYQRPQVRLPVKLTLFVIMLMEWVYGMLQLQPQSCFTSAMIHTLTCSQTFDCSKAQNILHYSPVVSLDDGIMLTIKSFSHSRFLPRGGDMLRKSKADNFLGNSEVADILLWRDEKKTFSYLLGLLFLFHWFLMSGRTFVTSMAKLLMLITVILFFRGNLPSSIYGFPTPKISPSHFEISEPFMEDAFKLLAAKWDRGVCILRSIAEGGDTKFFLKVTSSLYLFTLVLRVPLPTLIGVGIVSMFTVFIIYEQHEAEFDRLITAAVARVMKSWNIIARNFPGYLVQFVCK